jgi:hypothetical protein
VYTTATIGNRAAFTPPTYNKAVQIPHIVRTRGATMTVESGRDLAGLRRVGRVVALAIEGMKQPARNDQPDSTTKT